MFFSFFSSLNIKVLVFFKRWLKKTNAGKIQHWEPKTFREMIKPCFYSNWLHSKSPKENTRDQVSCPAEQKGTYLQNSDLLEENGRKRGWKRRDCGREEEQGYLCSFLFGHFEKEPLFPKPKQSFPSKRQWNHIVCQLCRTDCAARGPFFLLLKKKKASIRTRNNKGS